jgi:hypothetical protein
MFIRFLATALLLILSACGGTPTAQVATTPTAEVTAAPTSAPIPTATVQSTATAAPIATKMNGIWKGDDPPMILTIDVEGGEIATDIHGAKSTKAFTVEKQEGDTVTIKWTEKGDTASFRFLNDDTMKLGAVTLSRQK